LFIIQSNQPMTQQNFQCLFLKRFIYTEVYTHTQLQQKMIEINIYIYA
jgi:hypothetical protein